MGIMVGSMGANVVRWPELDRKREFRMWFHNDSWVRDGWHGVGLLTNGGSAEYGLL